MAHLVTYEAIEKARPSTEWTLRHCTHEAVIYAEKTQEKEKRIKVNAAKYSGE